jgi:hypothetical protein
LNLVENHDSSVVENLLEKNDKKNNIKIQNQNENIMQIHNKLNDNAVEY